jgi:hypothetical protein
MAPSIARHTSALLLDVEPHILRSPECPMCHTPAAVSESALESGADWRCVRCGQRWDAARLATVAAYAAWTLSHDRVSRPDAEGSQESALYGHLPAERLGGRP